MRHSHATFRRIARYANTLCVLAAAATLLLSGCTRDVDGNLLESSELRAAHSTSAAMPTTTPPPAKPISLDSLVRSSVRTSALFWQTLGINVDVEPRAVNELTCAGSTSPGSSAIFCPTTTFDLVKYDPALLNQRRANGGDLAVRIVMAHEVGHAAHYVDGSNSFKGGNDELVADCAAGAALADAGVDRNDAKTAIRATALGAKDSGYGISGEQRTGAFFDGFDGTISPMGCLSYTG